MFFSFFVAKSIPKTVFFLKSAHLLKTAHSGEVIEKKPPNL
jgi:hypothetical protein